MINSCVHIIQGPIKSFIDVLHCLKKDLSCVFPGFSHFGCPKPVFPRTVFTGKYRGKNQVPSKTLQPCIFASICRNMHILLMGQCYHERWFCILSLKFSSFFFNLCHISQGPMSSGHFSLDMLESFSLFQICFMLHCFISWKVAGIENISFVKRAVKIKQWI